MVPSWRQGPSVPVFSRRPYISNSPSAEDCTSGNVPDARHRGLHEKVVQLAPVLAADSLVEFLPGVGDGLLCRHAVEEQDVHDHPRLPVRPVADRDGVQVAADEPPVQMRVVQDANRHREEGDPVAAAPGLIPGQLAGHDTDLSEADSTKHSTVDRPAANRVKQRHPQVESRLDAVPCSRCGATFFFQCRRQLNCTIFLPVGAATSVAGFSWSAAFLTFTAFLIPFMPYTPLCSVADLSAP